MILSGKKKNNPTTDLFVLSAFLQRWLSSGIQMWYAVRSDVMILTLIDYVLFTWDSDKYHFSIITVTVLELKFSLLQQNLVIRVDSGSLSNLWQLGHSGFTAQFRSCSVLSLWGGQSLPAIYVCMTKLDVNHRIVWVGSDLKDNLVLTLLLWAGTPF